MKLLSAAVLAASAWCGLALGVVVGAVFGTLASMSTLFIAVTNPEFFKELRRTEHATRASIEALRVVARKAAV